MSEAKKRIIIGQFKRRFRVDILPIILKWIEEMVLHGQTDAEELSEYIRSRWAAIYYPVEIKWVMDKIQVVVFTGGCCG
jgi:hypothetical protein